MSVFFDHSGRERPHLEWKVRLFAAGGVLGVAGMWLEEKWLTGTAIAVLLVGVLLRLLPGRAGRPGAGSGDGGDDGPPDDEPGRDEE